jgi:hypothetical protein
VLKSQQSQTARTSSVSSTKSKFTSTTISVHVGARGVRDLECGYHIEVDLGQPRRADRAEDRDDLVDGKITSVLLAQPECLERGEIERG